jgi:hypothetical protein
MPPVSYHATRGSPIASSRVRYSSVRKNQIGSKSCPSPAMRSTPQENGKNGVAEIDPAASHIEGRRAIAKMWEAFFSSQEHKSRRAKPDRNQTRPRCSLYAVDWRSWRRHSISASAFRKCSRRTSCTSPKVVVRVNLGQAQRLQRTNFFGIEVRSLWLPKTP